MWKYIGSKREIRNQIGSQIVMLFPLWVTWVKNYARANAHYLEENYFNFGHLQTNETLIRRELIGAHIVFVKWVPRDVLKWRSAKKKMHFNLLLVVLESPFTLLKWSNELPKLLFFKYFCDVTISIDYNFGILENRISNFLYYLC